MKVYFMSLALFMLLGCSGAPSRQAKLESSLLSIQYRSTAVKLRSACPNGAAFQRIASDGTVVLSCQ